MSTTTTDTQTLDTAVQVDYAHPDATLVLPSGAPREQWLEARTQGIGGSDVSAIAGLNKWSSAYKVWLDKMGMSDPQEVNMPMRMGNLLEPIVRQLFTEDTGLTVRQRGLLRSKEHPFMQYTPDGFVEDGGLLEAKTSSGWLSEEWDDGQIPDHAELQVQHGLAVTGRSHAWVCGLLDGREFIVRRVERDETLIHYLTNLSRRFWEENVTAGVAPPVAASDNDLLKARHRHTDPGTVAVCPAGQVASVRADYEFAAAEVKRWTEQKDAAAAELRQLAGDNETVQGDDGTAYATLKATGPFSESRFTKDHPETAGWYETTVTKLDRKAIEADHPDLYAAYRPRVLRLPKIKTTA